MIVYDYDDIGRKLEVCLRPVCTIPTALCSRHNDVRNLLTALYASWPKTHTVCNRHLYSCNLNPSPITLGIGVYWARHH